MWSGLTEPGTGPVRVIYYFHDDSVPLFSFNAFAKNEKVNLTEAEKNTMRELLPRLVAGFRNGASK